MKIGVLSDSHIPRRGKSLPPALWEAFAKVELILHAGDLNDEQLLKELSFLAPVEAVLGNTDHFSLAPRIPRKKIITAGKMKIGLIHGDGSRGTAEDRAFQAFAGENPDCIVFGHTHKPHNQILAGVLMFNPGSCTDPRWEPFPSYGILTVEQGIRGEIFYIY